VTARLRLLVLVLALLLLPRAAHAERKAVVVIGGGRAFKDALTTALEPWHLEIVAGDAPAPKAAMPRAQTEAKAIADRLGAAGVVWISAADDERALFVFDGEKDVVISQSLASTLPFDPPTAAAAALSVKTLLRSSHVAPASERIGAEAAPPPPPPAQTTTEPPPRGPDADVSPRPHEELLPPIRIELGGGARAIAGDVDARIDAGGSVFFGPARRWGVGLLVHGGPGLGVDGDRFRGRFDELAVSPSLRLRLPLGGPIVLEPRAGVTLHATSIDGVAVATARAAKESRLDGSVDAGAVLDVMVGRATSVGLALDASYVLRWQRYLVDGTSVLELHPFQAAAGLRLATALP
jgi:hypothetical protein